MALRASSLLHCVAPFQKIRCSAHRARSRRQRRRNSSPCARRSHNSIHRSHLATLAACLPRPPSSTLSLSLSTLVSSLIMKFCEPKKSASESSTRQASASTVAPTPPCPPQAFDFKGFMRSLEDVFGWEHHGVAFEVVTEDLVGLVCKRRWTRNRCRVARLSPMLFSLSRSITRRSVLTSRFRLLATPTVLLAHFLKTISTLLAKRAAMTAPFLPAAARFSTPSYRHPSLQRLPPTGLTRSLSPLRRLPSLFSTRNS